MATQAGSVTVEADKLARALGANVYLLRVRQIPKLSQERLAEVSGVALETLRGIENGRDPSKPLSNPKLDKVERLAEGFRQLGVAISARDLLAASS